MTAVMLAAYPDVFAAGAPIAGIPYGCDSACMYGSEGKTAQQLGDAVRGGFSGFAGPYPRVSIWQGDADEVVDFANFGELVEQWTNVQAIDAVADATEQVGPATHRSYQDGSGNTLVESWQIAQGHHGTPVDPSNGCGKAGSYILDEKLCSSEQIAHFFGIDSPPAIADAGPGPGPDAAVLPGPDASPLPGEDAALSSDVAHADAGTFQDASAAGRDAFWGGGGSGCGCQGAGGADLAVAALLGAALLRALGRGSAKVASRPF
jgi:hypothetical protein